MNIVIVSIIVSFAISLVADILVIEKLRRNHSMLYKDLGSPWIGWNGFRNITYQYSFILMRKFKEQNLDSNILFWCNIKYLSLVLLFILVIGAISGLWINDTYNT